MNGVPYIMYDETYYKELNPTADFFTTNDESVELLDSYLSNTEMRNTMASTSLKYIKDNLVYKNEVIKMSNYMNDLLSKQKVMGQTDKLKEIIEFIKKEKSVTKKSVMDYLDWGRGIKWTPYRRALMNHSNIFDVNSEIPQYCWVD